MRRVTQTFARMLRLEGYEVRTAMNAETGLREARKHHPDAIILDLRMPLVDGLGFLRRLRADDGQRRHAGGHRHRRLLPRRRTSRPSCGSSGAELKFKPLWLEDLVGLARTLCSR